MLDYGSGSDIELVLKIESLPGDRALVLFSGAMGVVHSAIRVHLQILLALEDSIAYLAQALIVDYQVGLFELICILLLVEHFDVGHVCTDLVVLLDRQ